MDGRRVVVTIDIAELASICESMERRNRLLFERLGAWTTGGDPPRGAQGRLAVEACHRHAEHASLWADRSPTIPVVVDAENEIDVADEPTFDAERYRGVVERLRAELGDIRSRLDRDLDPSTWRLVDVVDRDLAAIADRISSA